tara:strand:+ start:374 stop:1207 length:834 start_codon:yes stop_codon:yes gene_type:complete
VNNFLTLENEYLKLQIDTLFGGKIVEIFDKKNKSNWVWFDGEKYKNFKPNQYSDYDSQWIGGYEELFPSDKIETFNNKKSPDHGELWASSWDIINKSKSSLELFCKGYFSNSEIIKRIEIQNNKIFINYDISKISLDYFLFKLHLALPIERNSVNFKFKSFKKVDDSFGNIVVGDDLNDFISSINPNQRKNDFVYFYGVDGKINVLNNDNTCIFEYDTESLPYLWIFQSRGGWNNLNVNVLEPCNSGLKDLVDAVKNDMIYLPKSNNYKTWYTIEVS